MNSDSKDSVILYSKSIDVYNNILNPIYNPVVINSGSMNTSLVEGKRDYLTVYIGGTQMVGESSSADSKILSPDLRQSIENQFNEPVTDFTWSGNNDKSARMVAAEDLNTIIANHQFAEGEKLNIVAHSHGGNVVKEFTQLYDGEQKIDNLVFLGTPHRDDYQLDYSDLSPNSNRINLYDRGDMVQVSGGGLNQFPADRTIDNFNNISIYQTKPVYVDSYIRGPRIEQQHIGPVESHKNLDSTNVWNQYVKPQINK